MTFYLKKLRQTPPQQLPRKARRWLSARFQEARQHWQAQWRDRYFPTYIAYPFPLEQPLYRYLPPYPKETLAAHRSQILGLADLYSQHYFECLGSGWVNVRHGLACEGLEGYRFPPVAPVTPDPQGQWLTPYVNPANLSQSQQIWQKITPGYCPIDWQLDFKSGYRWSAQTPSPRIRYAHQLGVDVKVPWELARMHHLPMLAWAYGCTIKNDREWADRFHQECRNQILDFIATNPPRYGVNWVCTMDVGIRIVNWLITYDLFQALGATWDAEFETTFKASVYEHGQHIIKHLEWGENLRSNHYLANIAGLLFVAAYLPQNTETEAWLAFAVQELIAETESQFHPDGTNFEASTSYHRLSAEMLFYSALLCLNLPDSKRCALQTYQPNPKQIPPLRLPLDQTFDPKNPVLFPSIFWERLEKAGEFTTDITKPQGNIPQIGDNDSGRFLKLWPVFDALTPAQALDHYQNLTPTVTSVPIYWDEQSLNHQQLSIGMGRLFNRTDLHSLSETITQNPETCLIETWLKRIQFQPTSYHHKQPIVFASHHYQITSQISLDEHRMRLIKEYGDPYRTLFTTETNVNLQLHLTAIGYPNFGLYLYKSPILFLCIRCGNVGQKGNGGHAHNDQLSIELTLNGQEKIRDPGTYLYTPLPHRRNQYRATAAHFTPQAKIHNQEQNDWFEGVSGLFSLKSSHSGQCLHFNHEGFLGTYQGFGHNIFRLIRVETQQIIIEDWGGEPKQNQEIPFSNGYGRQSRRSKAI